MRSLQVEGSHWFKRKQGCRNDNNLIFKKLFIWAPNSESENNTWRNPLPKPRMDLQNIYCIFLFFLYSVTYATRRSPLSEGSSLLGLFAVTSPSRRLPFPSFACFACGAGPPPPTFPFLLFPFNFWAIFLNFSCLSTPQNAMPYVTDTAKATADCPAITLSSHCTRGNRQNSDRSSGSYPPKKWMPKHFRLFASVMLLVLGGQPSSAIMILLTYSHPGVQWSLSIEWQPRQGR